jgi:molybdate transport system substrate-binding protein
MRNPVLKLVVILALLAASGVARAMGPLTCAVAANVKYAFEDLRQAFSRETGIEVKEVAGASGQLTSQIRSGAPFDVFLSADMDFPQALFQDGLTAGAPKVYAQGVLVLWTTQSAIDLGRGMQALNDPAVRKIAMPNPRLAPYGREAVRALEYFHLSDAVQSRLVYGESISQATRFVDAGAAEVGFTAKSVVLAPELKGRGKWIEVPAQGYQPIAQGVVILKHGESAQPEAARRFVEFLFSPAAHRIFENYGYIIPESK